MIDKTSADEIRNDILLRKEIMDYSEYAVIGFGGLLLIIFAVNLIIYRRRKRKNFKKVWTFI